MTNFLETDPEDSRIYVIGDIHGCPEELSAMLSCLKDIEHLSESDLVVFVGDYIDRGPDSKKVVDILLEFKKDNPSAIFLRGNHEDMLIDFLGIGEGAQGEYYIDNGGDQLCLSYGIELSGEVTEIREALSLAMPDSHKQFFGSLVSYVITPEYVFVHAGLNPLRDLKHQFEHELFWIRDEFVLNLHYFKKLVIFGHTPFEEVLFHLPYKIGVDTGLVFGNKLSCIELKNKRIFEVAKNSSEVKIKEFPSQ